MQEISLTSIGQTVGGVVARANQKVAFIVNSGRNGAWRRARTVGCQTKFTPILAYVTEVIKVIHIPIQLLLLQCSILCEKNVFLYFFFRKGAKVPARQQFTWNQPA